MSKVRCLGSLALALALSAGAAPARADDCKLASYGSFPIELIGARAITSAKINGQDARFIVDTGAFFSNMSVAMTDALRLQREPAPMWLRVSGVGGDVQVQMVTAREMTILGTTIHGVDFVVGGSDPGHGLLGSNFLTIGDLEADFSSGLLRLLKVTGCRGMALAIWAKDGNYQVANLLPAADERNRKAYLTVLVNGKRVHALLDSGATSTVISKEAAQAAGIDLADAAVKDGGETGGLGRHTYRSWVAPVAKYEVGTESIQNSKMLVIDGKLGEGPDAPDMLLGIDFFLAHHVLISNSQRKMYFTYNGGRVFTGSDAPKSASTSPPSDAPAPTDADGYAKRGEGYLARGETKLALVDLDEAIKREDGNASYHLARARARLNDHQEEASLQDLNAVIRLDPRNLEALMIRARLRLHRKDLTGGDADIAAARALVAPGSREAGAIATELIALDHPTEAIPLLDDWIRLHPEDSLLPEALNERCRARVLTNTQLEVALTDCKRALRLNKGYVQATDSLGLVQVRLGQYTEAVATYRQALAKLPKSAWSHYGLALALKALRKDDEAGAEFKAASEHDPKIAERAAKYGLDIPATSTSKAQP